MQWRRLYGEYKLAVLHRDVSSDRHHRGCGVDAMTTTQLAVVVTVLRFIVLDGVCTITIVVIVTIHVVQWKGEHHVYGRWQRDRDLVTQYPTIHYIH